MGLIAWAVLALTKHLAAKPAPPAEPGPAAGLGTAEIVTPAPGLRAGDAKVELMEAAKPAGGPDTSDAAGRRKADLVIPALDPYEIMRSTGQTLEQVYASIEELLSKGMLLVEPAPVHRPEPGTNPAEDIAQEFLALEREARLRVQAKTKKEGA